MILEALVRHYERLADNPDSDVAPFPFRRQRIALCVEIEEDGTLFAIRDVRTSQDGRIYPLRLELPYLKTRTSGDWANFLWDNTGYVLGVDAKTKPDKLKKRRKLFRDFHHDMAAKVDDPGLGAVCRFLDQWDPAQIAEHDLADEVLGEQVVFQVRNKNQYVHQSEALRTLWKEHYTQVTETVASVSLLTGEEANVCLTHPTIQGVRGANTTGGSIASFNLPAFESYGFASNTNAPLTPEQAFSYTTALNTLLSDDKHRVQLGDTTCVFWSEAPETGAPEAAAEALGVWAHFQAKDDGDDTRSALADFLERFRHGKGGADTDQLDHADSRFYILGLAPNAARISIRFWHQCTVAELAERLARFRTDLEIIPDHPDPRPLTIWSLLHETARETKDIPPLLGGAFARAVLLGLDYPEAMATALRRRIVADRTIHHARAAAFKAWLNRNHQQEIAVALDTSRTDTAYLLGRLFATYEKVQKDALGDKLNRTIRDSYLASASATPAGIFPRLYRLSQHHLSNLRRDKPGLAVVRERLIGEISDKLDNFPQHLNLKDQGLFALGYYHQTQDFYKKSDNEPSDAPTEMTTDA